MSHHEIIGFEIAPGVRITKKSIEITIGVERVEIPKRSFSHRLENREWLLDKDNIEDLKSELVTQHLSSAQFRNKILVSTFRNEIESALLTLHKLMYPVRR